ncbi:MAG: pyrrolo-quinoline quinone [Alphaproteobacteria bacterium]|nr:pyrrolo-quinoline quinone [Alphaproteobacteria bacterium]
MVSAVQRLWLLPAAMLALTACDSLDFLGGDDDSPLPGERISVLSVQDRIAPSARVADLDVRLPRPQVNIDWPQQGGFANHAMHHLALSDDPREAWSNDIGSGSDDDAPILSGPVIANGLVYSMDSDAVVTARRSDDGRTVWESNIEPPEEDDGNWGGGVAYDLGRIYAGTGFAQVVALDAETGVELWRTRVSGPIRSAPTAFGGKVYAVTKDNQLFAIDVETGVVDWTHTGIEEAAGLIGSASPAVDGDIVVVPYSSGEIFALRVENGRQLWSDNLAAIRRADAVSALADIRGRPVVDRGRVYAISHSGRMVAIDLSSGRRVWETEVGGVNQPWIAGNFLFVVSTEGDVVSLVAENGLVRWVTPLGRYEDPEDRKGLISWSGPVLASDRLIVTGSHGVAVALSPYTGDVIGEIEMPGDVSVAPALADETLYFQTDGARLIAYR